MRSTAYMECPGLVNASFTKAEIAPHLRNKNEDIVIDFELLTDEISSLIGLLHSHKTEKDAHALADVMYISELIYHASTALRIANTITKEEIQKLEALVSALEKELDPHHKQIVLPQGSTIAATCHLVRVKCNIAVRMLHKFNDNNPDNKVDELCQDLFNLASGYFLYLALKLNMLNDVAEIGFKSRLVREM